MQPHEFFDTDNPLLPDNLAKKYNEFIYERSTWKVGSRNFANKIEAIIESDKTKFPVEFHVDPRWQKIDFSKKPEVSIFDLFKERAAQIRRDYDYVRLLMGAGWDTHTVLRSFFEAGAKIDEIIINRKFIKSPNDLCCFEETYVVPKTLEYYKDFLKETKITIIDTDWKVFDKFYSDINFLRYHFSSQIEFHSGLVGYNPFYFCPELLKKFDEGIRAVNIMGTEKPRILKALDSYWYLMLDKDFKVSAPGHLDFFKDVNFPELAVLESHLIVEQKLNKIPLFDAIKSIRFPIPENSFNNMVHQYPSKYFPRRINQENNKGVAMAMEASLHPETEHLQRKWIEGIQYWVDLFPKWFPENWIPGKWINGTASYCFSLTENIAYTHDTVLSMQKRKYPDVPLDAHIHLVG